MAKEDTTKKEVKKEKKVAVKKPATKKAPAVKKEKKVAVKKPATKKAPTVKKKEVLEVAPKAAKASTKGFSGKYISTVGRRKTAVARVRLYSNGKNQIIVNGKEYREYFQVETMQGKVREPIEKMKLDDKFDFSVIVRGGGVDSQAEAIRHGIARAFVKFDENLKKRLRQEGFLTRDSRMKERKKPGLKRARKAPRWSKR